MNQRKVYWYKHGLYLSNNQAYTSLKVNAVAKAIVKWTKRNVFVYKNDPETPIRFKKITKKGPQGTIK